MYILYQWWVNKLCADSLRSVNPKIQFVWWRFECSHFSCCQVRNTPKRLVRVAVMSLSAVTAALWPSTTVTLHYVQCNKSKITQTVDFCQFLYFKKILDHKTSQFIKAVSFMTWTLPTILSVHHWLALIHFHRFLVSRSIMEAKRMQNNSIQIASGY